jgi:hypothetical protein
MIGEKRAADAALFAYQARITTPKTRLFQKYDAK